MVRTSRILIATITLMASLATSSAYATNRRSHSHLKTEPRVPEISQQIEKDSQLTDFAELINHANMMEVLRQDRAFTVFAPVNSAFKKLDSRTENLLHRPNLLVQQQELVEWHIVDGPLYLHDIPGTAKYVYTLTSEPVLIKKLGREYFVNDQRVVGYDLIGNSMVYKLEGFVVSPQQVLEQTIVHEEEMKENIHAPNPGHKPSLFEDMEEPRIPERMEEERNHSY